MHGDKSMKQLLIHLLLVLLWSELVILCVNKYRGLGYWYKFIILYFEHACRISVDIIPCNGISILRSCLGMASKMKPGSRFKMFPNTCMVRPS